MQGLRTEALASIRRRAWSIRTNTSRCPAELEGQPESPFIPSHIGLKVFEKHDYSNTAYGMPSYTSAQT